MVELLDFYADWCGPCKIMEPIIEDLEKDLSGKLMIKKINVDQDTENVSQFGVMSIPTYVVLKDGKEVERFIGAQSREHFVSKIKQHLS